MTDPIFVDVVVAPNPVVGVSALGVQGPPGPPGPPGTGGGGGPHAATHSLGQSDAVDVKNLAGYPGGTTSFLRADHTFAAPVAVASAHAATHQPGGADPMAVDAAAATGSLRSLGTGAQQAAAGTDTRFTNARTPTAHQATHVPGGSDPLPVDAAAATGSLRTLGSGAQQAAAGTDARFTNPRTPTAHASTHSAGQSDPVTVTALAGYPGGTANFLRADGTFAAPPGGGSLPADVVVTNSVAVGTNPAQSGAVRLANNQAINARSADNTADLPMVKLDTGNTVTVGRSDLVAAVSGSVVVVRGDTLLLRSDAYGIQALDTSNLYGFDASQFYPFGTKSLGLPNQRWTVGYFGQALSLKEAAAPGVAPVDTAYLYLEDNGSGKSRLMVQFATGAPIQVAIQV